MSTQTLNVGDTVRVLGLVWFDTYGKIVRIDDDGKVVSVKITKRVHKTTGKSGRVGENEVWRRTPRSLEKVIQ